MRGNKKLQLQNYFFYKEGGKLEVNLDIIYCSQPFISRKIDYTIERLNKFVNNEY